MWQPFNEGSTTYFMCSIDFDGHRVQASSRRKPDALAHALELLAVQVRLHQRPNP